jgi:adenylylsulfate kinase
MRSRPVSWAIWITGRPGSGKSTVARAAAARLAEAGEPAALLELDAMRTVITPGAAYTQTEHEVVYRALVFAAMSLTAAGVPVIIDATAHRRAWRDLARASIARFAEIQLDCPPEVGEARERTRPTDATPPGIYAGAAAPDAMGPGVNVPYERALEPELTIDTASEDIQSASARIADLALTLGPAARSPEAPGGAVVWLTGPPGSGKTTLATRLSERLAAEGVPVTMLEWAALRALVLAAHWATERDEEIAHRALVYTAKRLADTGLVVVVDATAPRRAWRTLARELVDAFAEVQLVCPPEVCLDRERAVRWGPHVGALAAAPDLAIEYEYSLHPDLLLDTQTRSEWTAAEDLVGFARRLLTRATSR